MRAFVEKHASGIALEEWTVMSMLSRDSLPITLFCTVDMQSDREQMLRRMLGSVVAYKARSGADVTLFILLQRSNDEVAAAFSAEWPDWIRATHMQGRLSLSAARNELLASPQAKARFARGGIVAFPDDDCWYPDGTLERIAADFAADHQLDFWFSRYGMDAAMVNGLRATAPSLQAVISFASSNTIVVHSVIAATIGGFDEALGVGAVLSGGEDTDYAIRAFRAARKALYIDAPTVGHRDPNKALKAKYYPGSLRAITKNTGLRPSELKALARKLLVGLTLVLRGQMLLRDYIAAVTNSFAR